MTELIDLPNIGTTLVQKLEEVGVLSAEQLKEIGSEQVFIRLQAVDPGACYNQLCALEGAVQNIRWHGLSQERKNELKEFFQMSRRVL
ncbi:MAG: TfoX/Sxy family protein [Marinifilaceae bacterium]